MTQGSEMMGKYTTEISKNEITQSNSTLKKLPNLKTFLTQAVRKLRQWRGNSTKMSSSRIPLRTSSFFQAYKKMQRKLKRQGSSSKTIRLFWREKRKYWLSVSDE